MGKPALIRTLKGASFETGTFEIYNLQKKNAAQLTLSRAGASKEPKKKYKNLSKKDNYTSASYNQQPTTTHGSPLDLAEGNLPPSPMGARRRLPLSPMGGRCRRCHSLPSRRIWRKEAHRRCCPWGATAAAASPPAKSGGGEGVARRYRLSSRRRSLCRCLRPATARHCMPPPRDRGGEGERAERERV